MASGTIKKLVRDRGFGFISTEDMGDVFFHRTSLVGVAFESLQEGQAVEFKVEKDPRRARGGKGGPRATDVKLL